jgi:RNA polymerase sigma-70 factor, ECF subfamily
MGENLELRPSPSRHTIAHVAQAEIREFTMIPSEDAVRMLAIAAGSRPALGELYDRYAGIARAVAFRILANEQEAEDVIHDAFLEVWRRAPTYDPTRSSVRTWIMLLVRSRALDRRRSAVFRTSVSLDHASELASTAAEQHDSPKVASLLNNLPEAQRTVLELGYFDGLSSTEIATRLSIPVGTVKSRVAAALAKLRETLTEARETGP